MRKEQYTNMDRATTTVQVNSEDAALLRALSAETEGLKRGFSLGVDHAFRAVVTTIAQTRAQQTTTPPAPPNPAKPETPTKPERARAGAPSKRR